jgi:hypothetical protein
MVVNATGHLYAHCNAIRRSRMAIAHRAGANCLVTTLVIGEGMFYCGPRVLFYLETIHCAVAAKR